MSEALLLVDCENVGRVDLAAIPSNVRVTFFFGASQRTVPTTFLKSVAQLGERFVHIDIEGRGKNALDFHIAFYLGEYLTAFPQRRCVILSNDKGFDLLIRHLRGRGLSVQRVSTLKEAFGESRPASLDKALHWLAGMQKNKRPRKRKGLVAHLRSHFGQKVPESEIQKLVECLIAGKQLSETNGAITYHF